MSALTFESLGVRRMPGIDSGFELAGLASGLNIVHGPNGSGKTTVARAVEATLWPASAPASAWVHAGLRLADAEWKATVEGRKARWQCNGMDAAAAVAPGAEVRDRYHLSLHELLDADDAGFAQAVARESAGGYDLAAAAEALRPRTTASPCRAETAALKEARARLDGATREQEALFSRERRLQEIQTRLTGRATVTSRVALLKQALEHVGAREAEAAAAVELQLFDPRMDRLQGDEADRLRGIAGKRETARVAALAAAADEGRARSTLDACGLPEAGLPAGLLAAVEEELDAARETAREIATLGQVYEAARARCDRAFAAIGGAVDPERLNALATAGLGDLSGIARDAAQIAAQRKVLEAEIGLLGDGGVRTPGREVLERGVWLLREWLRSAPGGEERARRLRALGTAAAVALVVAGLALALVHPLLAASSLVGVFLLVMIQRSGAEQTDRRPGHQADFGKLGLAAPDHWSADAVERRLAELEKAVASAEVAEEHAHRRHALVAQLDALAPLEKELADRCAAARETLGVAPATSPTDLVWLVEQLVRWHGASADAEGALASLHVAQARLDEVVRRGAERVADLVDCPRGDVAGLSGALSDLEARQKEYDASRAELTMAREALAQAGSEIEALEAEAAALLDGLGLGSDEAATVETWCKDHPPFVAARDARQKAEIRRATEAERLSRMDGFEPSLLQESDAVLSEHLSQAEQELQELEELRDEATSIRTLIDKAKQAHDVEEALAEVSRCEDALLRARERDVDSALAATLVSFVQGETRDQHLPKVFHRARELFVRVTHGRYRLDFDDRDPPAFRAFDTITGMGHPLEELSSATRIHLLMSVRLAFVETQEQGARLPLLFDETLGNSDDERAAAIMEALLELAAQGRQVFYFTAQPDEVGKWRGLLEERPEIPSAVVDLADVRRIARRVALPGLRVVQAPDRVVPAPGGMGHAGYGEALQVPALDPFACVDSAHLWYLVEDPDALHHLMTRLRAERWGSLRSLVEHGGRVLIEPGTYARAAALARALDTTLALRRVGRGRPLDRAALQASGAISEAFLDRVDELCRSVAGDPRRLLDALGRGEVKSFRTSSRDALQAYLENEGYLDEREPLGDEEIRVRALAGVADEISRGVLSADDVDHLLFRVDASLSDPTLTV